MLQSWHLAAFVVRRLRARRLRKLSRHEAFGEIYARNAWGSDHSVSGPGSDLQQTAVVREILPGLLRRLGARSMLDASCGDFHWMSQVDLGDVHYIGADIVPQLIQRNRGLFGGAGREFIQADITSDPLPQVDFILCRDCLMHLGFDEILAALANMRASGAKHVLLTTFTGTKRNADIGHGGWWPMNLQLPPFDLPAPLEIFPENPPDSQARELGKSLALWPATALPAL